MLFKLLGNIVTLPIKAVEAPIRVTEKLIDIDGEPGPVSEGLESIRKSVQEAFDEIDED